MPQIFRRELHTHFPCMECIYVALSSLRPHCLSGISSVSGLVANSRQTRSEPMLGQGTDEYISRPQWVTFAITSDDISIAPVLFCICPICSRVPCLWVSGVQKRWSIVTRAIHNPEQMFVDLFMYGSATVCVFGSNVNREHNGFHVICMNVACPYDNN